MQKDGELKKYGSSSEDRSDAPPQKIVLMPDE